MPGESSEEFVSLVAALAKYMYRSAAPVNISVEQRVERMAHIVDREAEDRRNELLGKLHRVELKLEAIELRLARVELDKLDESELRKWIRDRIAWVVSVLAGVIAILGFFLAF